MKHIGRKIIQVIFWIVCIFGINEFGRYLIVEFFMGGYTVLSHFYIVIAGITATLIATILFFTLNYIVTKKRKEQVQFSFSKMRIRMMLLAIVLAYIGEQAYLYISDYILYH